MKLKSIMIALTLMLIVSVSSEAFAKPASVFRNAAEKKCDTQQSKSKKKSRLSIFTKGI